MYARFTFRCQIWYDFNLTKGQTSLIEVADYVSAFPAGINVAATWDRSLAYDRGLAMGQEHQGKGVDVQLGPVCGPLGRAPEGGRNWVRKPLKNIDKADIL